jgi:protein involved in sex pheromone biosynthesis
MQKGIGTLIFAVALMVSPATIFAQDDSDQAVQSQDESQDERPLS